MHILDHEAPGLAKRLTALRQDSQHALLTKACLAAARRLSRVDPNTSLLLDVLESDGRLSAEQAQFAMVLSESADNRYFELKNNEPSNSEWRRLFSEARLLAAMAIGFGGNEEDVADAVYELTNVSDDPSEIIRLIESIVTSAVSDADSPRPQDEH